MPGTSPLVKMDERGRGSLLDYVDQDRYLLLPNTAGCYTADEAIRTARLALELGGWNWVKLEVIGDQKTLFPDNVELLKATETLVAPRASWCCPTPTTTR